MTNSYIVIFPDSYWGWRAATYFVDPITLPCFTIGLLGLALFWGRKVFPGHIDLFVKVALTIIAAYIAVESQSRSAFVALACLLTVYVMYCFRHSFKTQIIGLVGLIIGLTLVYFKSEIVHDRVNESVSGVLAFLFQDLDGKNTGKLNSQNLNLKVLNEKEFEVFSEIIIKLQNTKASIRLEEFVDKALLIWEI